MKTKPANVLCLLIAITFIACKQPSKAQQLNESSKFQKTSLTANFSTLGKMLFNSLDREIYKSSLEFSNPIKSDTSVMYTLSVSKPNHLFRLHGTFHPPTESFIVSHHTLLVMPGDSIVIDQNNAHVVYSRYGVDYIDSLIDSEKFYEGDLPEMTRKLKTHGVGYLVNEIAQQYQSVRKNLENFDHNNEAYLAALHTLNYVWKMNKIARIPISEKTLSASETAVLDSVYEEVVKNFDRISSIRSVFSYQIISSLISYKAYKQGRAAGSFWDYLDLVPSTVSESELYRSFLLNRVNSDYIQHKRIDKLTQTIRKVKAAGINDPRYDSLLHAKTALKKAASKPQYAMHNASGEQFEYTTLLDSLSGSYVFVDFWASWCGPCRRQMPYLEKLKPELRDKNIEFVAISIDNDDKIKEWIAASKDEGLDKEPFNFRLRRGNQNELLRVLEIDAVPRYFLYDPQGKLISGNFIAPGKENFKQRLLDEIAD